MNFFTVTFTLLPTTLCMYKLYCRTDYRFNNKNIWKINTPKLLFFFQKPISAF